jgi:hypothetical protein
MSKKPVETKAEFEKRLAQTLEQKEGTKTAPAIPKFEPIDLEIPAILKRDKNNRAPFMGPLEEPVAVASGYCTYPKCKCIVSTSTSQPDPECKLGLAKAENNA